MNTAEEMYEQARDYGFLTSPKDKERFDSITHSGFFLTKSGADGGVVFSFTAKEVSLYGMRWGKDIAVAVCSDRILIARSALFSEDIVRTVYYDQIVDMDFDGKNIIFRTGQPSKRDVVFTIEQMGKRAFLECYKKIQLSRLKSVELSFGSEFGTIYISPDIIFLIGKGSDTSDNFIKCRALWLIERSHISELEFNMQRNGKNGATGSMKIYSSDGSDITAQNLEVKNIHTFGTYFSNANIPWHFAKQSDFFAWKEDNQSKYTDIDKLNEMKERQEAARLARQKEKQTEMISKIRNSHRLNFYELFFDDDHVDLAHLYKEAEEMYGLTNGEIPQ